MEQMITPSLRILRTCLQNQKDGKRHPKLRPMQRIPTRPMRLTVNSKWTSLRCAIRRNSYNIFSQSTTNDGKVLTRVCVTDLDSESGKIIYDEPVKPPSPITDYLTRGDLSFSHLTLTHVFLELRLQRSTL
ncbi:hypothetical protein BJY52DRAFT_424792 [Lactarius psammicola]|nr:hypothetical protein BJY52DRAFT_424792 [Lactarius psammicola]